MSKRRRRKNPSNMDNVTQLVTIGAIGVGIYLVYQVYKSVTTGVGNAVNSAEQAADNFDQNIGLGPFDNFMNSLFAPPSSN